MINASEILANEFLCMSIVKQAEHWLPKAKDERLHEARIAGLEAIDDRHIALRLTHVARSKLMAILWVPPASVLEAAGVSGHILEPGDYETAQPR